jgi:hypothetical protein
MSVTMRSSSSSMPMPVLAEARTAFEASMPMTCSTCSLARSMSAEGRSILLITGRISRPPFDREVGVGERLGLDPLAASTISSAPSQAASERDTS